LRHLRGHWGREGYWRLLLRLQRRFRGL
jgi:hypothetical protein